MCISNTHANVIASARGHFEVFPSTSKFLTRPFPAHVTPAFKHEWNMLGMFSGNM